jgi:hypothetical protein
VVHVPCHVRFISRNKLVISLILLANLGELPYSIVPYEFVGVFTVGLPRDALR